MLVATLACLVLIGSSFRVAAQSEQSPQVVGVITGGLKGTYARFGFEMSQVLDSETLRILPVLGKGSKQNVRDLLYMNGVDVAIVQSDVLDYFRTDRSIPEIESSIRYIAKLYNEEIHVVVPTGTTSAKQLDGKLVSVGVSGSGTEMTANILFSALGVAIDPVNISDAEAISEVRNGNLAAAVFVVGKPADLFRGLDASRDLSFLPLSLPKSVQASYFDAVLSGDDYPGMIAPGERVPTLAVGAVLAVFNWRTGSARFDAVSSFEKSLADALPTLQSGEVYHPKWKEVDFSIDVPGWTRFGSP